MAYQDHEFENFCCVDAIGTEWPACPHVLVAKELIIVGEKRAPKKIFLTLLPQKEQKWNIMQYEALPDGVLASALDTISPKNHGVVRLGHHICLARGRIHEVQGNSAETFAMIACAVLKGPIFWCGLRDDVGSLSPLGTQPFFGPERLVVTEGVSRLEVLWAGEQALRTEGIASVVIELQSGPDLKESRRLQIAAEESGALGIILIKGRAQTSAAETRWDCDALENETAMWRWRCTKNKKGEAGTWDVTCREGGDGPGFIHLVASAAA